MATLAGACLVFWLVHDALVDDAYITLTYGRTLGQHGEWGLIPGYQSNTATSPLNVLLLGMLIVVVGEPVVALGILYVLSCLATVLGLRGLGRDLGLGLRVAVIGTPLLIANPLLASTIGLETTLVVAALAHLAWAVVRRDALAFGLVAGVMMWLRLDTGVIVAAVFVLSPPLWRSWRRIMTLAAAVVLPWLLFSWVVLGSAIPDTLIIKQAGSWGNFVTGMVERYAEPYPLAVLAVTVVAAVGVLAALTWWLWRHILGPGSEIVPVLAAAAAGYFGTIAALGVPPFFWYYGPTVAALTIGAAIALSTLVDAQSGLVRLVGFGLTVGVSGLLVAPWARDASVQAPLRAMPIHANWAYPDEYEKIGTELAAEVGDAAVQSPGEVGGLIYHCECMLTDRFSERAQILDEIEARTEDSWLMRLNYHFLDAGEVKPLNARVRLRWQPGPDPTRRGWNSQGLEGTLREQGHFELVRTLARTRMRR